MLATRITCPHCSRTLKTSKPLAAGKRVLCRQCGSSFTVPAGQITTAPAPAASGAFAPAAAVAVPLVSGAPDEPVEGVAVGKAIGRAVLVGAVLAGGFLFLAAGSGLALYYAATRDRQQAKLVGKAVEDRPKETGEQSGHSAGGGDRPVTDVQVEPVNDEPVKPEPPRLQPEEQARVDKAVEKGLAYLKGQQKGSGTWEPNLHPVGMAALPGLTLLECGVPADDAQVRKAARFVRNGVPNLVDTYSLSLAILFLDRLGDPADRPLIQTMALRLVAGQTVNGGWTYNCPILGKADEEYLFDVLRKTQPHNPLELFVGPDGKVAPELFVPRPGEKVPEFVVPGKGANPELDVPVKGEPGADVTAPAPRQPGPPGKGHPDEDLARLMEKAPPALKNLPALQPPGKLAVLRPAASDNSNTQFAVLAVWVGKRHELPLDRSIALFVRRFRTSQARDGTWGYGYNKGGLARSPDFSSPAMICAGLLGIGAGHGLTAGSPSDPAAVRGGVQDPVMQAGFKALEQYLGKPAGDGEKGGRRGQRGKQPSLSLYYLWSVERVGVMYNLKNIGDTDWYRWGAELLADHQHANGSWAAGGYPGTSTANVNTCLALLFLNRANVAKDLSKKLELLIDVKDIGTKR